MANHLIAKSKIKRIIILLFVISAIPFLFVKAHELASETDNRGYIKEQKIPETKKGTLIFKENLPGYPQKEEDLSELQKQARIYRAQGLEFQAVGNIDTAMNLYQKAIELDPLYAVAYNDLGVIYEAKGFIERAEESYLKAVQIDSNYLSAYTNLAYFYENKRNLDKALFYWEKRAKLGSPDDPWTEKARRRSEDIRLVLSERPLGELREREVMEFLGDVAVQKSILKKDNKKLAEEYFRRAKLNYEKGNEVTALKIAIDASLLDPSNTRIREFVDKVQKRLLSK